ncbi:MAG: tRNA-intron lyase [Candidatus Lokiarchaeota archaeon]|nr:tRNA-intron lyase [Candidatus Lokiarchaeota archaeon]
MHSENHITTETELLGIFDPQMGIWMNFTDQSRRFYEKSYYGSLYTEKKEAVMDSFQLVEESSDGVFKIRDDIAPVDKRPAYILLHPLEALYLMERDKLKLNTISTTEMTFDGLLEATMTKDPYVWQKYIVYRDIRHRGYIIRVGYGGAAEFRVFSRGARFAKDSAKYVFFIIKDGIPVVLGKLENLVNQVLGDRKRLILAIFDKLGDSTFYELEQVTFSPINTFEDSWNLKSPIINHEDILK